MEELELSYTADGVQTGPVTLENILAAPPMSSYHQTPQFHVWVSAGEGMSPENLYRTLHQEAK